jgi:hypothetical protein
MFPPENSTMTKNMKQAGIAEPNRRSRLTVKMILGEVICINTSQISHHTEHVYQGTSVLE